MFVGAGLGPSFYDGTIGAGLPKKVSDFSFENNSFTMNGESKSFADLFSFARGGTNGTASYTDSDGIIKYANINTPRYDYSTGTRGLLIELSRTNINVRSAPCSATNSWSLETNGMSAVSGYLAPDGSTDGVLLTGSATTGIQALNPPTSGNYSANSQYAHSIYVKPGTENRIQLTSGSTVAGTARANFLLTGAGTILAVTGGTARITPAPNGWYRISLVLTAAAAGTGGVILCFIGQDSDARKPQVGSFSGKNLYVWGAQVENSSYPTSYIKTSGVVQSRGSDLCRVLSALTTTIWDNDGGTIDIEYTVPNTTTSGGRIPFSICDTVAGSSGNRIFIEGYSSTRQFWWNVVNGTVNQASIYGVATIDNIKQKQAVATKDNDAVLVQNGAVVNSDTSLTIPRNLNLIEIGSFQNAFQLGGVIHRVYFNSDRLTNSQLQAMTA